MNLAVAIYSAILFFVLSPNVLLRLPRNGSKFVVAGVHALIFAAVLYFTQKWVWRMSFGLEGMTDPATPKLSPPKPTPTPTPTPTPSPQAPRVDTP